MKRTLLIVSFSLLMIGSASAEYCEATSQCWARCSNGCYAIFFPETGHCSAGCCFADGHCVGTKDARVSKAAKAPRDFSIVIRGLAPSDALKLLQEKTKSP